MAKGFKPTDGELEFANFVKQQSAQQSSQPSDQPSDQPKEKGFVSQVKEFVDPAENLFRAGVRGVVKGGRDILKQGGPFVSQLVQGEDEDFSRALEKLLPPIAQQTQLGEKEQRNKEFTQDVFERAGERLPLLVGGEGAVAPFVRSGLAGLLGETAKGLGFGPVVQTIAETPAFIAPKFGKNIIPKKSQREFVEFARGQELSEKQIAPLLQTERRGSGLLGKLANRGKRAQDALELAREGRNTAFSNLKALPEAQLKPSQSAIGSLFQDVRDLLKELPVQVGNLLEKDLTKFLESGQTQGDLAILWDGINFQFAKRGGKRLQPLKESITRIFQETSPEFAKQFELTMDLAKRFQSVSKQLTPTQASKLVEQFQLFKAPLQLVTGVVTGTFPWVAGALASEVAAKELAREMLTNPRLQNLGGQMVTAMKNSSVALANSAWNSIVREIRLSGIDQDTVDKLQDVDIEEFINTVDLSENGKKK